MFEDQDIFGKARIWEAAEKLQPQDGPVYFLPSEGRYGMSLSFEYDFDMHLQMYVKACSILDDGSFFPIVCISRKPFQKGDYESFSKAVDFEHLLTVLFSE